MSSFFSTDLNECEEIPDVCGTARCWNLFGSFECLCEDGYVYDNLTKSCVGELTQKVYEKITVVLQSHTWSLTDI